MKMLKGLIAALSLAMLASCAGQKAAVQKVEEEIRNESVVKAEDVSSNARTYITNSSRLTADQKSSLLALQDKSEAEAKSISEQINKAKMVLVKTLLEPKVNKKEVSILKKDLRKLSKKQIEATLGTIESARKIISPLQDHGEKEYLFNSFMMRQYNSY